MIHKRLIQKKINNLKKIIANRIKMPEIAFEMRRTLKVKKVDAPKYCGPLNEI